MSSRRPLFVLLCLMGHCRSASADHCDLPVEPQRSGSEAPSELTFLAKARVETGGFQNDRGRGSYQSISLELAYRLPSFSLWITLPAYRLRRESSVELGLGDTLLGAHFDLLPSAKDEAWTLRALGALSLPSGDAERELGMGHVMILPRLEAGRRYEGWSLITWVGAGLATETHGAHEAHGEHETQGHQVEAPPLESPGPIVSPMNPFEIHWGARVRGTLWDRLTLSAKLFAAHPIIEAGRPRITLGGILGLSHPRFLQEFEVEVPVVSDPFVYRAAVNLGYRF